MFLPAPSTIPSLADGPPEKSGQTSGHMSHDVGTAIAAVEPAPGTWIDKNGCTRLAGRGSLAPGTKRIPGAGRPKGLAARVRELTDFDKVIEVLNDIVYGRLAPAAQLPVRVKAAELLFNRGHGTAVQTIDVRSDGGGSSAADVARGLPIDRLFAMRDAMRALAAEANVIDAEVLDEDPDPVVPSEIRPRTDGGRVQPEILEALAAPEPAVKLIRQHAFKGSNNIVRATLDETGILCVWFTSGKMYRYEAFTAEGFDRWTVAPSAGKWFNAVIKPNHAVVK